MAKLHRSGDTFLFHCPGCHCAHTLPTTPEASKEWTDTGAVWTFHGDLERPSFTPSLLYPQEGVRCHCYIRDGRIEFLSYCDHALAGTTVAIPEWD